MGDKHTPRGVIASFLWNLEDSQMSFNENLKDLNWLPRHVSSSCVYKICGPLISADSTKQNEDIKEGFISDLCAVSSFVCGDPSFDEHIYSWEIQVREQITTTGILPRLFTIGLVPEQV